MTDDYDYDPDTAPGGHDFRNDDRVYFPDLPDELDDPFPVDDHGRHVLIVEPSGLAYIAPHLHPEDDECARLVEALAVFQSPTGGALVPAPGRYWCELDGGNFAIGSRVPDDAPQVTS